MGASSVAWSVCGVTSSGNIFPSTQTGTLVTISYGGTLLCPNFLEVGGEGAMSTTGEAGSQVGLQQTHLTASKYILIYPLSNQGF